MAGSRATGSRVTGEESSTSLLTRVVRMVDGSRRSLRNAEDALADATAAARRSLAAMEAFETEHHDEPMS